jgi:hypothetical protein
VFSLSIFFAFISTWAADPIIQKAQDLTLAKDRAGACKALVAAIDSEKSAAANTKKYLRALEDLSEIFYTDRAQKLFLEAEGQLLNHGRKVVDQFEEVRALEPGNVKVLKTLISLRLEERDCGAAEKLSEEASSLNPYSPELQALRVQVALCADKVDSAKLLQTKFAESLKGLKSANEFIGLWIAANKKNWDEVRKRITEFKGADANHPEVLYWRVKIEGAAGSLRGELLDKYLSICQRDYVQLRRAYAWMPSLCSQRREMEELRGAL